MPTKQERAAFLAAVDWFAIWKDGEQRIGVMEHPISTIAALLEKGEYDDQIDSFVATYRDAEDNDPQ